MLRAKAEFALRPNLPVADFKKAVLPSLSDFIYPVLLDVDPAQEVDDEFKHRHKQLFCWRMLKQIAQVDLSTFSGKNPQENNQTRSTDVFQGNIEEQARILCKQHMKREILDHLPQKDEDEEDGCEEKSEAGESGSNQANGIDEQSKVQMEIEATKDGEDVKMEECDDQTTKNKDTVQKKADTIMNGDKTDTKRASVAN